MSLVEIGCCGAYCKTCQVFLQYACRGCKIGYQTGERDISKAKCRMKVCCMGKGQNSCADCIKYPSCDIIHEFYSKNGIKYGKYQQAIEFIRTNGYEAFFLIADTWKNASGKY